MEQLDKGCSIGDVPPPNGDSHKKRLVRVAIPSMTGMFQSIVHSNCIHNQVVAASNRVCGVCPHPTPTGTVLLNSALPHLVRNLHATVPNDVYDMPRRHGGSKGLRYMRAADQYLQFGLRRTDANCNMFVKQERINPAKKVNPDPRAIQFRGARYCVAFAKYLRPIEEQLYLFRDASDGVPKTRNVAKGMNSVQRGEAFMGKVKEFDDPVILSLDMSRFDKHVYTQHLRFAHRVYLHCCNEAEFADILKMQFTTKCFSKEGLKYTVFARRMSGDMDTAIGNIVIMLGMVLAVCRCYLKLPRWDCFDDGDDCMVIVERADAPRFLSEAPKLFLDMGMEVKVDEPTSNPFLAEFCQSRLVEYASGRYKFVRDYRAVISKALCGIRHWENPKFRTRVLNAVGMCELVINLGVPVLQEFAVSLIRNTGTSDISYASDGLRQRAMRDARMLGLKDIRDVCPQVITPEARSSFSQAFGVDELEQVRMEEFFRSWTFSNDTPIQIESDWDMRTWSGFRSFQEVYPVGFQ